VICLMLLYLLFSLVACLEMMATLGNDWLVCAWAFCAFCWAQIWVIFAVRKDPPKPDIDPLHFANWVTTNFSPNEVTEEMLEMYIKEISRP
jgi:hypothetical protein